MVVLGMLSTPVVFPTLLREFDIFLLRFLVTAREQDHNIRAILTKIDPVSRSRVNPQLVHSGANGFRVSK